MKNKIVRLISCLSLASGLAAGQVAFASGTADVSKALVGASAVDLPGKAADVLAKAPAADKAGVAVAAVKAAVKMNPAITPEIVSALARVNPDTAPVVAVTAVTLQHKQIGMITKAATAAVPAQAVKIVAALLKEFPKDYGVIAIAASEGAPTASREILAVVAKAVPSLQAFVQSDASNSDVALLVNQAVVSDANGAIPQPTTPATPLLSGPTITPGGFQPFFGTVTVITPAQLTTVPSGGRHYAGP
jgi:hypothetical protein